MSYEVLPRVSIGSIFFAGAFQILILPHITSTLTPRGQPPPHVRAYLDSSKQRQT
ncbi:hypothetical protein RSAG8_08392, partial [Rhizoctonia solani AG-8 WAC10335]